MNAAAVAASELANGLEPFQLGEYESLTQGSGLWKSPEDPESPTYHHKGNARLYRSSVVPQLRRLAALLHEAGIAESLRTWGQRKPSMGLICESLAALAAERPLAEVVQWFRDERTGRWMDPEELTAPLNGLAALIVQSATSSKPEGPGTRLPTAEVREADRSVRTEGHGPQSRADPVDLDATERKVLAELRGASGTSGGRTLKQLVASTSVSNNSTVHRAIGRLMNLGYPIENRGGARGYYLAGPRGSGPFVPERRRQQRKTARRRA